MRVGALWVSQETWTVLTLLFHWSPLICTSIVFRDRGMVCGWPESETITVFKRHPTGNLHKKWRHLIITTTTRIDFVVTFQVQARFR